MITDRMSIYVLLVIDSDAPKATVRIRLLGRSLARWARGLLHVIIIGREHEKSY